MKKLCWCWLPAAWRKKASVTDIQFWDQVKYMRKTNKTGRCGVLTWAAFVRNFNILLGAGTRIAAKCFWRCRESAMLLFLARLNHGLQQRVLK